MNKKSAQFVTGVSPGNMEFEMRNNVINVPLVTIILMEGKV